MLGLFSNNGMLGRKYAKNKPSTQLPMF